MYQDNCETKVCGPEILTLSYLMTTKSGDDSVTKQRPDPLIMWQIIITERSEETGDDYVYFTRETGLMEIGTGSIWIRSEPIKVS